MALPQWVGQKTTQYSIFNLALMLYNEDVQKETLSHGEGNMASANAEEGIQNAK